MMVAIEKPYTGMLPLSVHNDNNNSHYYIMNSCYYLLFNTKEGIFPRTLFPWLNTHLQY